MKHIRYDSQIRKDCAAAVKLHQAICNPEVLAQLQAALARHQEQERWRNDPLRLKQKLVDAWLKPLRKAIAEQLRNIAVLLED
jgi:hypothetical protein